MNAWELGFQCQPNKEIVTSNVVEDELASKGSSGSNNKEDCILNVSL